MNQKSALFFYERHELIVLGLIVLLSVAFAFTIGVHLGKQLEIKTFSTHSSKMTPDSIKTQSDRIPSGPELTEQGRAAPQVLEETMEQNLHSEIKKTGLKLKEPRQVQLPEKSKAPEGGATTLEHKF